jgi:broad specificity phosphatase PhoE
MPRFCNGAAATTHHRPPLEPTDQPLRTRRPALRRTATRASAADRVPERHRRTGHAVLERDHGTGHSSGKRLLVAAHGNSIRALVKYLDKISDERHRGPEHSQWNPLVYELDANLKPLRHYYLGDAAHVAKAAAHAVAAQGQA